MTLLSVSASPPSDLAPTERDELPETRREKLNQILSLPPSSSLSPRRIEDDQTTEDSSSSSGDTSSPRLLSSSSSTTSLLSSLPLSESLPYQPIAGSFSPSESSLSLALQNKKEEGEKDEQGEESERTPSSSLSLLPPSHLSTEVDPRDRNTPDNWVPRHPELIRLTGKHPFNCEPPLSLLYAHGFLSPLSLHYVRNHGAVPKIDWDTHKLRIVGCKGRGEKKREGEETVVELSMKEITSLFPLVSLPVTLVCAGNRRKEQNMVRQSKGFSWGAAAVSTNVWTGVRLSSLLEYAGGVDLSLSRFVSFEGDDSLPKGKYGTCIDIGKAIDPFGDVLIAFLQNGERLSPDHGFPLRVIIPGWIGGRMVKWLKEIRVSSSSSLSYYHFYDNRILPSHVLSLDQAEREGWWQKPDFLFNELNINSAIVYPEQGETLLLTEKKKERERRRERKREEEESRGGEERRKDEDEEAFYTVKGYAYSGGGRKVTRVEVSLDGGETWRNCTLDHPEERLSLAPSYGRYWCWCFWTLSLSREDLLLCALGGEKKSGGRRERGERRRERDIRVRAWDAANNRQPSSFAWNLLGMGNNCEYKVKVLSSLDPEGRLILKFQHPTVPGPGKGGWMEEEEEEREEREKERKEEEEKKDRRDKEKSNAGGRRDTPTATTRITGGGEQREKKKEKRLFSRKEVARHNTEKDCWIIVRERVYDCTPFLSLHPGGVSSITMNAGEDCTEDFEAIHSSKAWTMLEEYYVGDVEEREEEEVQERVEKGERAEEEEKRECFLNPKKWLSSSLVEREELSPDTLRLRFSLEHPEQKFGLPVGHHVLIKPSSSSLSSSPSESLSLSPASSVSAPPMVIRAYTPTSSPSSSGHFELVVKVYRPLLPLFPQGGLLSQHLSSLSLGESIKVKGPIGHFEYLGRQGERREEEDEQEKEDKRERRRERPGDASGGEYILHGKRGRVRRFGFLCAGSGITPAFQIIREILGEKGAKREGERREDAKGGEKEVEEEDDIAVRLIYGNRREEDILLRKELEDLAEKHRERFHLWFTLSSPPSLSPPHSSPSGKGERQATREAEEEREERLMIERDSLPPVPWPYGRGRVDREMIFRHLFNPRERDVLVGICGPEGMVQGTCIPSLKALGYSEEQYFVF